MTQTPLQIIEEFNDTHRIKDVIEQVTGISIKGTSMPCPIHGGDNKNGSSINIAKNIFTCWTSNCGRGLTPWNFIAKYYNLNDFKEIAKKINAMFNMNIPIYSKDKNNDNNKKCFIKPSVEFNATLKNNEKYISGISQNVIYDAIREYKHIVLQAPTGTGKTYSITTLAEIMQDKYNLDYVFFLAPTRSIVENITSEYPQYKKFYGDDTEIIGKLIAATYHKGKLISKAIDDLYEYNALLKYIDKQKDIRYMVVVDEVHQLLSNRNILGIDLCKEVENLIINSDYSLCMSANTNEFINAYKNKGLYNYTIKIESSELSYNINNFYIYRCSNKFEIRLNQMSNKIIDNLGTHEYVLICIDNKKELESFSEVLTSQGIEAIIINSDNKDEEEIRQEYLNIVNNSKLTKTVVLCTSIINAGVNIKNKNVLTIIYQNKNTFDTNKIEQLFGRVRTDVNNDVILFLNQPPKKYIESKKVIRNIENNLSFYQKQILPLIQRLNEVYFDYYYDKDNDFKNYFEMIKENEEYKGYKEFFYIENNIVKSDEIGLYEKSRLQWLKDNYYNNDFIKEMLKGIKAKNKHDVITLSDTSKIDISIKENKNNKITLDTYLMAINEDEKSFLELYHYMDRDIKSKDFNEDLNIQMYEQHKNNSRFKEFINTTKNIFNGLSNKTHDLEYKKLDILRKIIDIFTMKNEKNKLISKKNRDKLITNMKRVEIYNKMYPLGTDKELINSLGDIEYYYIRSLDKLCNSRNKPSKKELNLILNEILKSKKYIYVLNNETFENAKYRHERILEEKRNIDILKNNISGSWYDKKGKKINLQLQLEALEKNIRLIYNCTEKLYIYTLN